MTAIGAEAYPPISDGDQTLREALEAAHIPSLMNALVHLTGDLDIIRGEIGSGQEAEGLGFAISMGTTAPVSRQLIEHGRMVRPRMGVTIEDVNPALAIEHRLAVDEGVRVVSLAPGGPADRAGVRVNDVIVRVDDVAVTSTSELVRLFLTLYEVSDPIVVTVDRDGRRISFEMVLEEVTF